MVRLIDLMNRDFDLRNSKFQETGSLTDLTGKQIRDYHVESFQKYQLPIAAWSPEIPLKLSNYSEIEWQRMLSDPGSVASYLDKGMIFTQIAGVLGSANLIPYVQDEATAASLAGAAADAAFWLNHMLESGAWRGATPDIDPFVKETADGLIIGGSSAQDQISGGSRDDLLFGYGGDDTLSGRDGKDALYGGAGSDILTGGRGSDVLHGGSGPIGTWGGDGFDTANYALDDAMVGILLDFGVGDQTFRQNGGVQVDNDGSGGTDKLYSIEKLIGSNHDDVFVFATPSASLGLSRIAVIDGGQNDSGVGYGGDILDFSHTTQGFTIESGHITRIDGQTVDIGISGFEKLVGTAAADNLLVQNGFAQVDGAGGNDEIDVATNAPLILAGGDGADTVRAGPGNDLILGGPGNDTLFGSGGRDLMTGNSGVDTLSGGDGNDVFVVAPGQRVTILDPDVGDQLLFGVGGDVAARYHLADVQTLLTSSAFHLAGGMVDWSGNGSFDSERMDNQAMRYSILGPENDLHARLARSGDTLTVDFWTGTNQSTSAHVTLLNYAAGDLGLSLRNPPPPVLDADPFASFASAWNQMVNDLMPTYAATAISDHWVM